MFVKHIYLQNFMGSGFNIHQLNKCYLYLINDISNVNNQITNQRYHYLELVISVIMKL